MNNKSGINISSEATAPFETHGREEIGGQAIMDGVMLRRGRRISMAVRTGTHIIVKSAEMPEYLPSITRLPIIRGIVALFESLVLGIKSFAFSAQIASEEEGSEHAPISRFELAFTLMVAFATAAGLFIILPSVLAHSATGVENSGIFTLMEAGIRFGIFLTYVWSISRMKDVKKIFEYHGAEHKVVSAWEALNNRILEARSDLGIIRARDYSRFHPRCGTSFLMVALLISSALFSFFPATSLAMRVLMRFIAIPFIVGITFELIKIVSRTSSGILQLFAWPGLAMQKLTTLEPDDFQIEVAIAALKELFPEHKAVSEVDAAQAA